MNPFEQDFGFDDFAGDDDPKGPRGPTVRGFLGTFRLVIEPLQFGWTSGPFLQRIK